MADAGFDGVPRIVAGSGSGDDATAYRDGYDRAMRELAWARRYGWTPSERQLVLAISHAMSVYASARRGKFIGGQRPEWLHGRADALRELLRMGTSALPTTDDERDV
jgi:hypothetical protein